MNDRFLYEIHPVRPFTTKDGKLIKKACSILLTKEEVKEYIKICPIYRKVSGATNKMIRVTLANLDDLHTPTGTAVVNTPIPVVEEKKEESISAPVEEAPVESEKVEESTEVEAPVAEPIKEESTSTPVEEAPAESEKVEESTEVEDTHVEENQNTEEESVEEISEDTDEETTESVDDILKEGTVQSNYQGKKKHKHH